MTGILSCSNTEENYVNIWQYRNTLAEVRGGTWCIKNGAWALFPVCARSVKMAVQKTSIFGEVYLFSDTVVCAFSEATFEEILASIWCPKTFPICNIFIVVAALSTHAGAQLNMGQSDSISNCTMKFVISYHIVIKQVEVSTKSTGSWLHAGTCPVFVCWIVLEI